jgi:ring-1,2-phenylacetyl-CoA epoxidase subunit PaaE
MHKIKANSNEQDIYFCGTIKIMRPKFHPLTVIDIRRETKDCVSVAFEVPSELKENYHFHQGQYLTLRETIGGEDIRRSYSICSGVNESELRVAIKEVPHGKFSTWANRELVVGHTLQVMTPMGHFGTELNSEQKKCYLLVAAGSGITPVFSIAKSVLATEPESEVILLFGNRYFQSIIFRDQLEDLKDRYLGRFRVFHVLSAEPNDVDLFSGRIDRQKLEGFAKGFIRMETIDEVFVCGPEPLIRLVKEFSLERGISEDSIHFELFGTPNPTAGGTPAKTEDTTVDKGARCAVTVVFDGQENNFFMPMDGTAILDAAQSSGMDIPFSCKGGMCCT